MLEDLSRAVRQLEDARTRRWIGVALGVAILTFALLTVAGSWTLTILSDTGYGWLDRSIDIAGIVGSLILAALAFPIVVSGTLGLFADQVCDAVERRHYPHTLPTRHQPLGESLLQGGRFALLALTLNILILPLYLLPGPNILIYLALNGFLLGREYFDAVALRRYSGSHVAALRRRLRLETWTTGVVIALTLSIPFVNLVAPVIGVSLMTHRYHRWRQQGLLAG